MIFLLSLVCLLSVGCLAYVPLGLKHGKNGVKFKCKTDDNFDIETKIGSDVSEILKELFQKVSLNSGVSKEGLANDDGPELSLAEVEQKFNKIFSDIKENNKLTEIGRRTLYTEATLMIDDAKAGGT